MKNHYHYIFLFVTLTLAACVINPYETTSVQSPKLDYALAIHGGAGTISRENLSAENEADYRRVLNQALDAGQQVLVSGGSAVEAVQQTIIVMENSPLFNAGKGAVFTHDGRNEMDASIMSGIDQTAGAVGGVTTIKNPIKAARAVMEQSPHVMLVGKGAEIFSIEQQIEQAEPEYFFTQRRWDALQKNKSRNNQQSLHKVDDSKFGTVGAVALDQNGNLAAGTSTGGMTNKRWSRIGDSPVIGAGTYADNSSCAVSATGHGEYFIRYAVAHDICARLHYKKITLQEAADEVVMQKLVEKGGSGGVISMDAQGNIAMPFNTSGMYRGYVKPGARNVSIYKND